ncbi:hypothetical protein CKO42_19795 [Lamprobacter modestohalophilus]|uniref:Methyltransferase type 11 domain-containing protein n=1 Tax=Lamprobacter modestohalophilus TaxID=1064514 RepID=A0A9X0WCG6_9GAMM|nr:class I SAM-dependent methyltransferase [Lamprobacter modestohalophilus]MBK1620630.1 hypothetical protein [Lamprobacter modestohalophilus]
MRAGGGTRIFDNACGVNATAFLLASAGLDLTGTDLNDQASPDGELPSEAWSHVDTKKFQGSMRFQTADSLALPFSDGEFDASYSISSLEHMPDPVQAVKEMIRVTRSGGLITFTMDVSPLSSPVEGESNVNLTNFSDIQDVLQATCSFFAPPRFDVPDDVLSWHGSQRDRTALHGLLKLIRRHFADSKKDRNFYIFCGSYIKR